MTDATFQDFVLRAGGTFSCGRPTQGMLLEASVVLDSAAAPWGHAFAYSVTVDGKRYVDETHSLGWGGEPAPGFGGTRLYRLCDDPVQEGQLAAGTHEIVISATLEGAGIELSTPPASFELHCPSDLVDPDPSSPPDADTASGSGCSIHPRAPHPNRLAWPAIALAAFGLLLRRTRRARRSNVLRSRFRARTISR